MKAKSRLKLPSSRSTAQSRTLQTSSGYMISKLGAAEFRRRGEDLKKKGAYLIKILLIQYIEQSNCKKLYGYRGLTLFLEKKLAGASAPPSPHNRAANATNHSLVRLTACCPSDNHRKL